MDEPEDHCLFCKAILKRDIKIDIQFTTTELGHENVEEFIKKSVLGIHAKTTLEGQFICNACYDNLNKLEDYLLKSKDIQQSLLDKYLHHQVNIKQESYEISSECQELLEPKKESNSTKNNEEVSKSIEPIKNNKEQKRKTLRRKSLSDDKTQPVIHRQSRAVKRKSKPKVISEDDDDDTADEANQDEKQKEQKHCCEICGKVTNKGNAAKHMNIHTKKHLYVCEYCNKNFTQKVDLRRHLNIHMGIFPYVCEFCGKKFAQHTSYNIHKKNHLGLRDFKCIVCDKAMLSKSHLVRHMRTHTSEKNYGCDICGKSFAEKYNRTSHMRKVHMKEPSPSSRVQEVNCEDQTEAS